jgi:hypothetical protein
MNMLDETTRAALRGACANSDVLRAMCEVISSYKRGVTDIRTHMMEKYLTDWGYSFNHSQVIAGFRELQAIGVGKYWAGRRGSTSRFEFVDKVTVVSSFLPNAAVSTAGGCSIDETNSQQDGQIDSQDSDEMISHRYVLRPGLSITIQLPADLTDREAQRISQFVGCLSFEDDVNY